MAPWIKIGALWKTKSKNGNDYLTGEIEIDGKKTKIVAWPNTSPGKEDHPEWPEINIFLNVYEPPPGPPEDPDKSNPSDKGDVPL